MLKAIIINLPRSTDRKLLLQSKFKDWSNTHFHYSTAVDGKELGLDFFKRKHSIHSKILNRDLTEGELGCLYSHKKVWQLVIEEDIKECLILEDDVDFAISEDQFKKYHSTAPQPFDLIYYGFRGFTSPPPRYKLHLYTWYPIKYLFGFGHKGIKYHQLWSLYARPKDDKFDFAGAHHGSHAYLITKDAANKLIKYTKDNHEPVDLLIGMFAIKKDIKAYKSKSQLFWPNTKFLSTITDGAQNRH